MLDLRLPAEAVGIAAPAACTSAPGSVAVFNLCIAVTSTRLDTVRVVFDKVVDIIVEIRVRQAASCLKPPGRKKTPGISLWNYDVDDIYDYFFQICLYHHHQVNLLSRNERQEAPSKKYRFM